MLRSMTMSIFTIVFAPKTLGKKKKTNHYQITTCLMWEQEESNLNSTHFSGRAAIETEVPQARILKTAPDVL